MSKLSDAIGLNEKIKDKVWFNDILNYIKDIYAFYEVDYNFDNIVNIIQSMNIVDGEENDITSYDYKHNTLILGESDQNKEYNRLKSFIQITSQKGLIIQNENGEEKLNELNELIIDRIITNTIGIFKDKTENDDLYHLTEKDEKRAKEDELLFKINKVLPIKELIDCFVNQNGEELYNKFFKDTNDYAINKM